MTFLLAALAYLPLGFVVAACWLEAVSAFKRDHSNQPGVITVLFGGLVVILVATIVHFALPLEPMPVLATTDGAGAVAAVPPEAAAPAAPSASGPAWPATAPRWASLLGLASLALLGGAYGLRLHFRRLEAAATAAQSEPEPPTPKQLRRLRKKATDVQLGYWFALLACALLVVFNVLGAPGFNPLGQAVAFLPLSLLGVAVWLEIVSSAKASESNQPAALTTIFAAAVTSLVAVGAAFLATPDERLESLSVAPAWKSVWGFAAFAFVSLAYLLKLRAVNQRARSAALAATMSKPGAAYSYGRKLRMQQASASPVAYGFTVVTALVFLCLAHFRVLTKEGELVAKIQEATSKASESIARASQSGPSTLDQFSEDEGTLGGLLAANTVTNLPSPMAEEEEPPSDDTMDNTEEEDPLADPAEDSSEPMTAEATAPPDSESGEPAPTPEVAMNESPAEATTPPPAPAPDPAAMDPTEAPPGESATLSAAETAVAVSHIQPYDNGRFFSSQVRPILASICYECHGSEQKKGGLQLHTPEALVAGGNGGAVVVAGNPDASSLYVSTTLSPDDPDIMPAKGNPLNPRQTAILRKWILDGAHLPGGQATSALLVANNAGGNWKIDQDSAKLSPPNPAVIQLLEQQGVQFRALSANSAFIKADYSHVDRSGPLAMESLAPIAANIYWLDLTRSQVADADLAHVSQMQNIRTLELNRTRISDAGLSHLAQLPNIEVLNLYGTGVSDAGLNQLAGLATLRKLYIWETQVTQAGIDAIKQAIPELDVIAGN